MDAMIDTFVTDALIETGAPAAWVLARSGSGVPAQAARVRMPKWTPDEEAFYMENVGKLSYEDIAYYWAVR